MVIHTFKRYEKKYLISQKTYETLCEKIEPYMNADPYCEANGSYSIYNMYFDTISNDVIRHSISKPYYKEKLRLRSYHIPTSLDECVFLELKKKIDGVVSKRRVTLSLKEAYDFVNQGIKPKGETPQSHQVIDEISYFLKMNQVRPTVLIRYDREAYFSKEDTQFRLTFDRNIRARRDRVGIEYGGDGTLLKPMDMVLMEVKILGAIPKWFSTLMSDLAIYPTRFSKYGTEFEQYCKKNREPNRSLTHGSQTSARVTVKPLINLN